MNRHTESHGAHMPGKPMGERHYARLGAMAALSFIAMYVLMYAMVDTIDNVYMNFNQIHGRSDGGADGADRAGLEMKGLLRGSPD